jgi:hypothetical protein
MEKTTMHDENILVDCAVERKLLENLNEQGEGNGVVFFAALSLKAINRANGKVFVVATVKVHGIGSCDQ